MTRSGAPQWKIVGCTSQNSVQLQLSLGETKGTPATAEDAQATIDNAGWA